jgi:NAD(P) transhydrogenase
VYDSDTILRMERLPHSLTIVGGRAIGCEYACLFKVLGLEEVRVINAGGRILPFADDEISNMLREAMESLGIEFHMPDPVENVVAGPPLTVHLNSGKRLLAEALLVTLGRRGNVAALKLENAGVRLDDQGHLSVNDRFQTNVPHIYAAGDVIGGYALSSMAMEQARMAMVHAFDLKYKSGVSPFLPIGVWTIPEISMVGETEPELRAKGVPHVVGRWRYDANPRGVLIGERWGLLKLLFFLAG